MSVNSVAAISQSVDELGQQIIDRIGLPKDSWEIAAQLEVLGMRDTDARSYGARDLFDLARTIDSRFRSGVYSFAVEGEDPRSRVIPLFRFVRRYLNGITFAAPMALQAAAMLLWGYGLWGALDLELTQGSAIALGFIASYVVAGGFTQSIVRRGLFYIYQKEEVLARATALRGFALALRVLLALAIPVVLANAIFRMLPWTMVLVALAFYAGLGVLWLTWALLYLLRKTWVFTVVTAAGLIVVLACAKWLHMPSIVANACGVVAADVLSFAIAYALLNRMVTRSGAAEPVNPPRLAVLVFSTSRYFVYGILFNAFLFADRVIAWTTPVGREDFPPYGFWLNVRYELAMDLALIVAMLMAGAVEFALERFSEELVPHEKRTKSGDAAEFIDENLAAHRTRSIQLAAWAIGSVGVAVCVFALLLRVPNVHLHEALTSAVTMRVFVAASIGYVFFTFGVRNLLVLLTLGRVDAAVRCVAIALATDVVIGFIASRAFHFAAAVTGFVGGAIVLALLAARAARRTLERLDYFYFAAF